MMSKFFNFLISLIPGSSDWHIIVMITIIITSSPTDAYKMFHL